MSSPSVRRALASESAALTALGLRSKAHWGYDEAFMALAADEMNIGSDLIGGSSAYVAESDGAVVGVYVLCLEHGQPTLRDLWVEPRAIGTGVGSILWAHMLGEARRLGYRTVRLTSDPNAEGFYLRMGARRIGEVESCGIPGRMLPRMEVEP